MSRSTPPTGCKCPRLLAAAGLLLTVAAAPAFGSGFLIYEQGAKAMGMAGAFTAQANDGSAMFHNVGGLAFLRETRFDVGVTLIDVGDATFEGLAPFPGPGAAGEQDPGLFYPPHLYYVRPLNERLTFGIGVNAPFGLSTEWANPETWPGRYISAFAELRAFDFNPSIGWKLADDFGVGFGVVGRISDVSLLQFVPQRIPFNQTVVDVARADLESDFDTGFGWNVGVLHQVGKYLSWGLSYRSKIEIDYGGDAVFTQIPTGNPQLDALVAAAIPFGQQLPIETSIEFPDVASVGVALGLTRRVLLEADVNWVGWSSFDVITLAFTSAPQFTTVIPNDWDDAYNYRLGVQVGEGPSYWRFGYIYDETPQPAESVGPLLPDADRNDYTIGYGNRRFDVALMYVDFGERTTTTNRDDFFGTYKTDIWLLGLTVKF